MPLMSVLETTGDTQLAAAGSADAKPGGALGKDEFLNLLVTQMQNQDPLDPTDSAAMVAQLAQFSSLEQMQNLNSQFDGLRRETGLIESLALEGQQVTIEMGSDTPVTGTVEKLSWTADGAVLVIDGEMYPMKDITSIIKSSVPEVPAPAV